MLELEFCQIGALKRTKPQLGGHFYRLGQSLAI